VQPLIFWVVAVEQQKRIYEKWKVIDNRNVKRSVIINLIDRYAEILVEESGHGGIPIEAVASFGLAAWQGEELADGSLVESYAVVRRFPPGRSRRHTESVIVHDATGEPQWRSATIIAGRCDQPVTASCA
jgi:hypothetical protein